MAKLYKNELEKEVGKEYEKLLERAIFLSKADLTTLMVDEFGELKAKCNNTTKNRAWQLTFFTIR